MQTEQRIVLIVMLGWRRLEAGMNNTVYAFVRHCLLDDEFNRGGIPSKESDYLERLGWTVDDENTHRFYDAVCELYELNKEANRKGR